MSNIRKLWTSSEKHERAIFLICVLFFVVTLFILTLAVKQASDPLVKFDDYRVILHALPFLEGDLSYFPKVEGMLYSLHVAILHNLFGGNYVWSAFIVVVIFSIVMLAFLRAKSVHKTIISVAACLLVFTVFLIPTNYVSLEWPLVFSSFSYFIILGLVLVYFANIAQQNMTVKSVALLAVVSLVSYLIYDRAAIYLIPVWGLLVAYKLPPFWLKIGTVLGVIAVAIIYEIFSQSGLGIYELMSKLGQSMIHSSYWLVESDPNPLYAALAFIPILFGTYFVTQKKRFIPVLILFSFYIACIGGIELRGDVAPRHLIMFRGLCLSAVYLIFVENPIFPKYSKAMTYIGFAGLILFGLVGFNQVGKQVDTIEAFVNRFDDGTYLATYLRAQDDNEVGDFTLYRSTAGSNPKSTQDSVLEYLSSEELNVFAPDHFGSKFIPSHEAVKKMILENEIAISDEVIRINPTGCTTVQSTGTDFIFRINGQNSSNNTYSFQFKKGSENVGVYYPVPIGNIVYFGKASGAGPYNFCPFRWTDGVSATVTLYSYR